MIQVAIENVDAPEEEDETVAWAQLNIIPSVGDQILLAVATDTELGSLWTVEKVRWVLCPSKAANDTLHADAVFITVRKFVF